MPYTYSCESVDPFWYWFSGELITYILTEMVAVPYNQVIRVTIVNCRLTLHELSNLEWIQACHANENWPSKLEARALSRFNLKDTTWWVLMRSKGIFYTMNCKQAKMINKHCITFINLRLSKIGHQFKFINQKVLLQSRILFDHIIFGECRTSLFTWQPLILDLSGTMYWLKYANLLPRSERYQGLPNRHSHLLVSSHRHSDRQVRSLECSLLSSPLETCKNERLLCLSNKEA